MTKEVPICRHPDGGKCEHCVDYEPEAVLEERVKELEARVDMLELPDLPGLEARIKAIEDKLNWRAN